jgi:hypothetical protein
MNAGVHAPTTRVLHSAARVRGEARDLVDAVEATAVELEDFLRTELRQRPYLTLALAAGAGYILGGGLPTRVTGLLFTFGTRVAMAIAVRELTTRSASDTDPVARRVRNKGG